MKSNAVKMVKYIADDDKVFDWADLHSHLVEDAAGNTTQQHLYASALYIGSSDNIANYREVDRYGEFLADEGKIFDYVDAETRGEHYYKKELKLDYKSGDRLEDYIEIDTPEDLA
jgi:hypothetical protein